jgi:hypothetical protein
VLLRAYGPQSGTRRGLTRALRIGPGDQPGCPLRACHRHRSTACWPQQQTVSLMNVDPQMVATGYRSSKVVGTVVKRGQPPP